MRFNKIGKYLPGFSAYYYSERISPAFGNEGDQNEIAKPDIVRLGKFLAHILYGTSLSILLGYSLSAIDTDKLNPFEQNRIRHERKFSESLRYQDAWNKLFRPNGYADTDGNGKISPDEFALALNRMKIIRPELNDLEKLIKYYEELYKQREK